MKGLVKLGIKNLGRYKRRTIITAVAVAFGLMMFIMVDSMLKGVNLDSEINIIRYEAGSGKVVSEEYWKEYKEMPVKKVLDASILQALKTSELQWTPRIEFPGELIFRKTTYPEDGSLPAKITAIDPLTDENVFYLKDTISQGRYLLPDEDAVVIGGWLAEDMGIEVGFPLDIQVSTRFGGIEVMELEVVGIVDTPNPSVNRNGVFLPITVADDYLEMDGLVTQVALRFSDLPSVQAEEKARLEALLAGTNGEFHDWGEWAADFLAIAQGKQNATGSILSLLLIIAAVGISNTILMSIFERVRELGMMRALGMTERDIRTLFLVESGGIGLLGGFIGFFWGALINVWLTKWGLDYSFMMRDMDVGYRITGLMFGIWNWGTMFSALFIGVAMCLVISWFSTRKINRLEITSCLRFQ